VKSDKKRQERGKGRDRSVPRKDGLFMDVWLAGWAVSERLRLRQWNKLERESGHLLEEGEGIEQRLKLLTPLRIA
jgi:hypothetical protein